VCKVCSSSRLNYETWLIVLCCYGVAAAAGAVLLGVLWPPAARLAWHKHHRMRGGCSFWRPKLPILSSESMPGSTCFLALAHVHICSPTCCYLCKWSQNCIYWQTDGAKMSNSCKIQVAAVAVASAAAAAAVAAATHSPISSPTPFYWKPGLAALRTPVPVMQLCCLASVRCWTPQELCWAAGTQRDCQGRWSHQVRQAGTHQMTWAGTQQVAAVQEMADTHMQGRWSHQLRQGGRDTSSDCRGQVGTTRLQGHTCRAGGPTSGALRDTLHDCREQVRCAGACTGDMSHTPMLQSMTEGQL
jgi:hypothetical protein